MSAFNLTDCLIYHGRVVSAHNDMATIEEAFAGTPLGTETAELKAALEVVITLVEQRIVELDPECTHPFTTALKEKHNVKV